MNDGDSDPTLDFGFVLLPEPAATALPTETTTPPTAATTPPTAGGNLANTGFDGALLMALGLLPTVLGGGAVALTARRRRTSTARH